MNFYREFQSVYNNFLLDEREMKKNSVKCNLGCDILSLLKESLSAVIIGYGVTVVVAV